MLLSLFDIKVFALVLLFATITSASTSAPESDVELPCRMMPWQANTPRTHLNRKQIIDCLQLPSEEVDNTFKQIYYLENVPTFAGGIRRDSINPQQLYDTFLRGDDLAKVQIKSALRRLYRDDGFAEAEIAKILSFGIE